LNLHKLPPALGQTPCWGFSFVTTCEKYSPHSSLHNLQIADIPPDG
jgi:hypothetical protein